MLNRTKSLIAVVGLLVGLAATEARASALVWPVSGTVTCTWYYSSGGFHGAVDIGGNSGAAVGAARGGRVITASYGWNGGYGNCVRIQHGNGYTTDYHHFVRLAVGYGWNVGQLQTLGWVGATGMTTGPHCHFDLRRWGTKVYMPASRGQYLVKGRGVPGNYPGI